MHDFTDTRAIPDADDKRIEKTDLANPAPGLNHASLARTVAAGDTDFGAQNPFALSSPVKNYIPDRLTGGVDDDVNRHISHDLS